MYVHIYIYIHTRIYGRATRALASPLYLLAALCQGQRLSLSHAQFSFGFCTKNLRSGEVRKSACESFHNNPNRPANGLKHYGDPIKCTYILVRNITK